MNRGKSFQHNQSISSHFLHLHLHNCSTDKTRLRLNQTQFLLPRKTLIIPTIDAENLQSEGQILLLYFGLFSKISITLSPPT